MVKLNCKFIRHTQPSDWVTTNNTCMYRAEKKSLQILLSSTQAGPGRKVKQEQEPRTKTFIGSVQCDNYCDIKFQEHTIISVRYSLEIFPREFSNSTGDGGGPKRYRVNANPWRVMRILGSLGYQIPVTPAGLRDDYDTFHG